MQFGTLPPTGAENGSPAAPSAGMAQTTAFSDFDVEVDPTLRLLQTCVEAMSLLQAKFVGLEVETQIKLDAASREIHDLRSSLADARSTIAASAGRLQDSEDRVARLEISAVDFARQHADDIGAARADAATARLRGETDHLAFDHLMARLTTIENGLVTRLDRAALEITDRDAENKLLRSQTEAAQAQTRHLQAKLHDVESTIADQRSRIKCLHSKLATANYAMRIEQLARQLDVAALPQERDILDLQSLDAGLISAA